MLKPMATILIVEDDALLQDALTGQLKQLNYGVCTATSVAQGMAVLQDQAVDGIILDLGLPDADGLDLLTWARTRIVGLPVLILTARDGIDDRVRGLNAGADDYLTKPFNMQELQARLQAMLRRARQPAFTQATSAQGGPSTTIGNLQLDHQGRVAALDGQPLELTQREWELLELLVNRCGEVVTRDDVLAAWRASPPSLARPPPRSIPTPWRCTYTACAKSSISPASTSATSAAWGTCSKSHEAVAVALQTSPA